MRHIRGLVLPYFDPRPADYIFTHWPADVRWAEFTGWLHVSDELLALGVSGAALQLTLARQPVTVLPTIYLAD